MTSEALKIKYRAYKERKRCARLGIEVPEWAKSKKFNGDPLERPEKVTDYARKRARVYANKHNLPVPEWAKWIIHGRHSKVWTVEDTKEPKVVDNYRKHRCRKICAELGIDVPEWARLKEVKEFNPDIVPENVTPYAIQRCRDWCRSHSHPYPDWAKLKRELNRKFQAESITETRPAERVRDSYNAALVLTDVRLALWTGKDCYWRRADEECVCMMDPKLTDAIKARSESAFEEAMRVCIELNPDFGKPEKSKPEKHVATEEDRAHWREYARKNSAEKTAAWRRFKTENGIKTPPKDSNRITRVARVEYAR